MRTGIGDIGLGWSYAAVAAAIATCAGAAHGQESVWNIPAEFRNAVDELSDGSASERARQSAADLLVRNAEIAGVRKALVDELGWPLAGSGGGRYVLRAIASQPLVTPRLFPALAQRLDSASPEEAPEILTALRSFRTRDSARLLVRWLVAGDTEVRTAACRALVVLSGREDLGQAPEAWQAWLDEIELLTESQWRLRVSDAQAARAARFEQDGAAARASLLQALRDLHLATPAADRPALLAKMLGDATGPVRDLGFELVARELATTGRIDGPVGEAAVALLKHAEAGTRARAAGVVRQIGPPGADLAVAEALAQESDPRAAAAMLTCTVRWPTPAMAEGARAWLRVGSGAFEEAASASWWLWKAGRLERAQADEALTVMRGVEPMTLTPQMCALMVMAGTDADRAVVAELLSTGSPAVRTAAAETLMSWPEHVPTIIGAALHDPSLFDAACRAALQHDATPESVRALISVRPGDTPESLASLVRLARGVEAAALWSVVSGLEPGDLRRAFLEALTTRERVLSESPEPENRAAIGSGAITLAEELLGRGELARVVTLLESTERCLEGPGAERGLALRCSALVGLGRLEAAEALNGGPEAWLRGLELARDKAFAGDVVRVIESTFGSTLAEAQRTRLNAVKQVIADAASAAPTQGG